MKMLTGPPAKKKDDEQMSGERIYQKKTQLEQILLQPDTYIGSVQTMTKPMGVLDPRPPSDIPPVASGPKGVLVQRDTTYVPGFYKIFDEIMVNAADSKQSNPKMDTIKIDINQEEGCISIINNGKGISIVMHKEHNLYVPTMIFGHLLTGSNFNGEEDKVTGGRNGFGAKLCNMFSTKVETADKSAKKSFKQTWASNMSKRSRVNDQ